MTMSSKASGIALLVFLVSLPWLSRFHAPAEHKTQDEALQDFYQQVFVTPERLWRRSTGASVTPCLIDGVRCADLYPEPVTPCLLSGGRCDAEAQVTLLESRPEY